MDSRRQNDVLNKYFRFEGFLGFEVDFKDETNYLVSFEAFAVCRIPAQGDAVVWYPSFHSFFVYFWSIALFSNVQLETDCAICSQNIFSILDNIFYNFSILKCD